MKYKLIALDIDGTLIDDNHNIPQENIDVINMLQDRGAQFVLATGRPDTMATHIANQLGITSCIIGCNGATTRNLTTNELHVNHFNDDTLREIYSFFKSNNLFPRMYSAEMLYSFNPHELDEEKNPNIKQVRRILQWMDIRLFNDIEELIEDKVKIIKMIYPTLDRAKLDRVQSQLEQIKGAEVVKSDTDSVDIMVKNVSKGEALLRYAKSIGIDNDKIIAIGNGDNDISMLSQVGLGITLENAEDNVKDAAHIVTASNNNAGVAKALRKIFEL